MPSLITLSHAIGHLRLSDDFGETTALEQKIDDAEYIILEYIARPTDATWTATIAAWTDETVPGTVRAAILLKLGELWRDRGDEDPSQRQLSAQEIGDLSPAIVSLLRRTRDPVLA